MEFVWPNCGNVVGKCCGTASQKVRFEFFRQVGEGWIKTFTTPYSTEIATPYSGPVRLPLTILCNSDMEVQVRVSAVTEDGNECNRTVFRVWQLEQESEFKGKVGGGSLTFTRKELVKVPLFIDYLRSGWQISFSCAIDYTGSNGNYTNPTSLHFIGAVSN